MQERFTEKDIGILLYHTPSVQKDFCLLIGFDSDNDPLIFRLRDQMIFPEWHHFVRRVTVPPIDLVG